MPAEDQVIQIYAATNGYLDRITVDKIDRFLAGLTTDVRGNEPELLKKIADGDWSDETQKAVEEAVKRYAEDFGYDLDEEGHPLEEGDIGQLPDRHQADESGNGDSEGAEHSEQEEEQEEEAVTA
jgi:F-type H+-transporting ATPase subunit alpha